MRLRSLDHLVLTVRDQEETVAFYERLGMRRESLGDGRIALHFGHQKLNLHTAGEEVEPHARRPQPGSGDLCLLVEGSILDVITELEDAGVELEEGPVDRTGAEGPLRSVYLRDPDGTLVELSEPLEA